jgi:hypothetical protein
VYPFDTFLHVFPETWSHSAAHLDGIHDLVVARREDATPMPGRGGAEPARLLRVRAAPIFPRLLAFGDIFPG